MLGNQRRTGWIYFNNVADLVLDNDIPEIIRKIAHIARVPFVFRRLASNGTFGKVLQLVFDVLESSGIGLARTAARGRRKLRTRTGMSVA